MNFVEDRTVFWLFSNKYTMKSVITLIFSVLFGSPKARGLINWGSENFRFIQNEEKVRRKEKVENVIRAYHILVIIYHWFFFIVSLILLYKTVMEKNYEKRCQLKRVTWNNLNLTLLRMRIHAKVNIKSSSIYKKLEDSAKKH